MHILIPTGTFPPQIGGPATYVPRIAHGLVQHGHQVTVVTLSRAEGLDDRQFDFEVVRLDEVVQPGNEFSPWRRWLYVVPRLFKLMKQHDLIYVNGLLMETGVASLFVSRPMLSKVVGDIVWERAHAKNWTEHDIDYFQHHTYPLKIEMRRIVREWALHRMQPIIVPSAYLKEIVHHWYVDMQQIKVIYNAYEPPITETAVPHYPRRAKNRLVTVCRLVDWKGVDRLLQLLPRLPDTELMIIGDGEERGRLEAITERHNLTDRVIFTGLQSQYAVIELMKTADLFVLNSAYEGLPHVLLEALAIHLPIVATQVGGTSEVVIPRENGELVPPGDLDALRDAICHVLHNRASYQPQLPPKFTHEMMLQETIDLLETVGSSRE